MTDSPHMRVSLLETGRFITFFPASALRFLSSGPALKILAVELPVARRPNGIVTLRDRALSPVAQLLINSARELAKPMAKQK